MLHFRDLRVWQATQDFVTDVYIASRVFPPDERFGLTAQLRRASVSIAANIAESAGRYGPADQTRMLQIAMGSAYESESHLSTARRLGFISEAAESRLVERLRAIEGMLGRLIQRRRARMKL